MRKENVEHEEASGDQPDASEHPPEENPTEEPADIFPLPLSLICHIFQSNGLSDQHLTKASCACILFRTACFTNVRSLFLRKRKFFGEAIDLWAFPLQLFKPATLWLTRNGAIEGLWEEIPPICHVQQVLEVILIDAAQRDAKHLVKKYIWDLQELHTKDEGPILKRQLYWHLQGFRAAAANRREAADVRGGINAVLRHINDWREDDAVVSNADVFSLVKLFLNFKDKKLDWALDNFMKIIYGIPFSMADIFRAEAEKELSLEDFEKLISFAKDNAIYIIQIHYYLKLIEVTSSDEELGAFARHPEPKKLSEAIGHIVFCARDPVNFLTKFIRILLRHPDPAGLAFGLILYRELNLDTFENMQALIVSENPGGLACAIRIKHADSILRRWVDPRALDTKQLSKELDILVSMNKFPLEIKEMIITCDKPSLCLAVFYCFLSYELNSKENLDAILAHDRNKIDLTKLLLSLFEQHLKKLLSQNKTPLMTPELVPLPNSEDEDSESNERVLRK